MSYYDTIEEDLARTRAILATGSIYGADTFAAYKLLESFVAEIERTRLQLEDALAFIRTIGAKLVSAGYADDSLMDGIERVIRHAASPPPSSSSSSKSDQL